MNQLDDRVKVCVEPCRRCTFPAIALLVVLLYDFGGASSDKAAVICPVDSYMDNAYFELIKLMEALAVKGGGKLILMGIRLTYPGAKYRYIVYRTEEKITPAK